MEKESFARGQGSLEGRHSFSESGKGVIDAAAARAERQLLRMRVKARKGAVRKQRAASAKN
jgi:hypothetical protein